MDWVDAAIRAHAAESEERLAIAQRTMLADAERYRRSVRAHARRILRVAWGFVIVSWLTSIYCLWVAWHSRCP